MAKAPLLALLVASSAMASPKALRDEGYGRLADAIERRVGQKGKKMGLTAKQADALSADLMRLLPKMPKASMLADLMPRSVVELVASVSQRKLALKDAEDIASFHIQLTGAMGFRNLKQFDSNHSHVIGRRWNQIDYSGEGVTWRQRQRQWSGAGVKDFRTAGSICRYMRAASRKAYFMRIYKPRKPFPEELEPLCR